MPIGAVVGISLLDVLWRGHGGAEEIEESSKKWEP